MFIPLDPWLSNSPDLNPIDYQIWALYTYHGYQKPVRDVLDLRQRLTLITKRCEPCCEWHKRLLAYVDRKEHFEHLL